MDPVVDAFYTNALIRGLMSTFFIWCFFFKQKTAYEMRISDWSSDVCSSDLVRARQFKCEFAKLQSPFLQIRLPPMVQTRLYAGRQLRQLRAARALRQADFATPLGISAS